MSPTRHALVTAIALALWVQPLVAHSSEAIKSGAPAAAAAWPSESSISNLALRDAGGGEWLLDFDYAYPGAPLAAWHIELIPAPGVNASEFRREQARLFPPQPGTHHIATALQYPGEGSSVAVVVSLVRPMMIGAQPLATARVDKTIQWPTRDEMDLRYATDSIDNGSPESIEEARVILERLVEKNPGNAFAFVEMARIAMKTNWGAEGRRHAESLLDSALQLDPESVDAKILLGYVYTHQNRFDEAVRLFTDSARSNPPNLWLWTNWGELLEMQGKPDQAITKYREAITRPNGPSRSYKARSNAYFALLRLLETRQDVDGMEAVYKQRIQALGPHNCRATDYARFKLYFRGDAQGAIDIARSAMDMSCERNPARQIVGLASYVHWAKSTGPSSTQALNQARVFLPAGASTLSLLAESDKTVAAVEKLITNGELIDQLDNDNMTALGLALQNDKLDAAERLLKLGARAEMPIGFNNMPAALMPVLDRDIPAVRLMQRHGVNYSKLKYQGTTAVDYAEQMGDAELLDALRGKGRDL